MLLTSKIDFTQEEQETLLGYRKNHVRYYGEWVSYHDRRRYCLCQRFGHFFIVQVLERLHLPVNLPLSRQENEPKF